MSIAPDKVVVVDYKIYRQLKSLVLLQFDTNIIKFVVEDNGEAADFSNITNIVVNFRRPDKKVISQVLTAVGNEITYKLTDSEMLVVGVGELVLQLYDDTDRISIARFNVEIKDNIEIGDAPTVEEARLITQLVEAVNEKLAEIGELETGAKGDPFTYEDFTQPQLEALRGPQGPQGPPGASGTLSGQTVDSINNLTKLSKLSTDFSSWHDLSAYVEEARTSVLGKNNRGTVKIAIPPGDYYITDVDVFGNFPVRTSGLTISGAGRSVTRVHFIPTLNNQYLFKNNDKLLQMHFEDISFYGNLEKNTNFMLSISHGGAQNYTLDHCNFEDFDKVFDLQGTNNNSEFTFNHCGFYGTIKDGVLFVGEVGTSQESDQFLNYNFLACQFEVYEGNFINMKYGGNVNVYGGSFIHIGSDSDTALGGTFFNFPLGVHHYGVCRLLVVGARFEHRNRRSKLINSTWTTGNIEFLNCDSDTFSQTPSSVDWEVATFSGQTPFPVIKFDNCSLMGKHKYIYNTGGSNHVNSIVYQSCMHSLLDNIEDLFLYETNPNTTTFNNLASRPTIKIKDFKVNADKGSVFDTTLNGTTHGRSVLEKKVLAINNVNGSLPNRGGSETIKLPKGTIITKVVLYCPPGAVTSGMTANWTLSTSEATATILANTLTLNKQYRDGFSVQSDAWIVCDTDEKRTLVLKDNGNIDQVTVKGLCLVEYI